MKKYSIILSLLICHLCNSAFGQSDSARIENLDFRLKKIEEYRQIDDKKFENKSKELDLRIEEYRQQKTILDWIALGVGGLTILSLWGLFQKAKAIADKKIEEKLDKIFDEKKQQLVSIIESHDKENKLKRNNSILIVASHDAQTEFLMEFFRKLGFAKPELKKVSEYTPLEPQVKYDILFLFRDGDNHPLSDEIAHEYIKNSRTDSIVFIFGNRFDDHSLTKSRTSSATFWSQLYGNLVSALKYQELID